MVWAAVVFETRDTLEEHVAARQQRDEQRLLQAGLPDDLRGERRGDCLDGLPRPVELVGRQVARRRRRGAARRRVDDRDGDVVVRRVGCAGQLLRLVRYDRVVGNGPGEHDGVGAPVDVLLPDVPSGRGEPSIGDRLLGVDVAHHRFPFSTRAGGRSHAGRDTS